MRTWMLFTLEGQAKGKSLKSLVMFPNSTRLLQPYYLKCNRKLSSTHYIADLQPTTSDGYVWPKM